MHDLVALDIASSGMAAQRIRMSVLASNLANAQSTRNVDGSGPYKRQMVVFESGTLPQFKEALAAEKATAQPGARSDYLVEQQMKDVAVSEIRSDPSVRRVYEPSHPDADAQGYVTYPDISVMEEMTDMLSATRNYEANLAVSKNTKDMVSRLIDLLKA